jgi:hypothetical protein
VQDDGDDLAAEPAEGHDFGFVAIDDGEYQRLALLRRGEPFGPRRMGIAAEYAWLPPSLSRLLQSH